MEPTSRMLLRGFPAPVEKKRVPPLLMLRFDSCSLQLQGIKSSVNGTLYWLGTSTFSTKGSEAQVGSAHSPHISSPGSGSFSSSSSSCFFSPPPEKGPGLCKGLEFWEAEYLYKSNTHSLGEKNQVENLWGRKANYSHNGLTQQVPFSGVVLWNSLENILPEALYVHVSKWE